MNNNTKNIFILFALLYVLVSLIYALHLGLVKHERNECYKWIEEYHAVNDYYFVDYQVMQCQAVAPELLIGKW